MSLVKKLSLPSELVYRKKPCNNKHSDKHLFKKEFVKKLPNSFPIVEKYSYIPPCGSLFNGIFLNLYQFNIGIRIKELFKSYLKSLFFLTKVRKITRLDNFLYVTNSNSKNFFHWYLDVMQKLELINQSKNKISSSNLKIIIPNGHEKSFSKKSLEAFDLNFYHQKKFEFILSNNSIYVPDIAPTGNYRKALILKLAKRMRKYWIGKKKINSVKRRIYISRNNSNKRKLKNENEIIPILKKNGFIIVDFDKISFDKQLDYVLNSNIIISVHGAALTHMLWMKRKSKILEIRARDNCDDNCYFSLASDLEHNYFYVIADKTDVKKSDHFSDLKVDPNNFLNELEKIIR